MFIIVVMQDSVCVHDANKLSKFFYTLWCVHFLEPWMLLHIQMSTLCISLYTMYACKMKIKITKKLQLFSFCIA